ncbi:MAG: transporter substrate-binding domain-containing protein [Acidobacteriota bacterium]
MRAWPMLAILGFVLSGCTKAPEPTPANATPPAPALIEIKPAPDQVVGTHERDRTAATLDLDAIADRGYVRVLIAPSRTHFETVDGAHHGLGVDVGVALAAALSQQTGRMIAAVFVSTSERDLIPHLLAGYGDVAANLLLTFVRDDQVAFAPPIKTGIREVVVTKRKAPLVSLEDVGGRTITVRKDSDHHASLVRLNDQLKKVNHATARVIVDGRTATDEDLLDQVNSGRIDATIVDDYILDRWQKEFSNIVANRDVAVSQDGILAWVTRKDAPKLLEAMKAFFSTHELD